jgi:5-methylcytosine-specific restriction enzyme A
MHKPLRPCAAPGCAYLIRNGQCPDHPTRSGTHEGYGRDWAALAAAFLAVNPTCWCGRAATEVDHIVPIRMGGARLDWTNLRALCHPHHSLVTALYRARYGRPRPYPRR